MVKPADGSSGRAVRLVATPDRLRRGPRTPGPARRRPAHRPALRAQLRYGPQGVQRRRELYATERCSLLHPGRAVRERQVPLTPGDRPDRRRDRRRSSASTSTASTFCSDPDGPVVVDINDFPSFRQVPDAVARVSAAVLELARDGQAGRRSPLRPPPGADRPAAAPGARWRRSGRGSARSTRPAPVHRRPCRAATAALLRPRRHREVVWSPRTPATRCGRGHRAAARHRSSGWIRPAMRDLDLSRSPMSISSRRVRRGPWRSPPAWRSAAPRCSTPRRRPRGARTGSRWPRWPARAGLPFAADHLRAHARASWPRPASRTVPLVIKSRHSRRHDLVARADSAARLRELAAAWPEEPVVVQEFTANSGWDHKLWVVDGRLFAALRRSELAPDGRGPTLPLPVGDLPAGLGRAALRRRRDLRPGRLRRRPARRRRRRARSSWTSTPSPASAARPARRRRWRQLALRTAAHGRSRRHGARTSAGIEPK